MSPPRCLLPITQLALNYLLFKVKCICQLLHYLLCTEEKILLLAHFKSEYYSL